MDIQPAEISAILKREIQNFGAEAQVSEVGEVLSVGDGIARVHGLDAASTSRRPASFRASRCMSRCRPG
jgi:F0F1-type ATP synthase alpha subunit